MAAAVPLLDLLRGEEDASRLVFPGARPLRELPGFGTTASSTGTAGRRRRRRRHEPRPPQDWEEVFEAQEAVVLRAAQSTARWPPLTIASLGEALPMAKAHVSPAPTVQIMSRVQPWGALLAALCTRTALQRQCSVLGGGLGDEVAASGCGVQVAVALARPCTTPPTGTARARTSTAVHVQVPVPCTATIYM